MQPKKKKGFHSYRLYDRLSYNIKIFHFESWVPHVSPKLLDYYDIQVCDAQKLNLVKNYLFVEPINFIGEWHLRWVTKRWTVLLSYSLIKAILEVCFKSSERLVKTKNADQKNTFLRIDPKVNHAQTFCLAVSIS